MINKVIRKNNQKYRINCLDNPTQAELILKKYFEENNVKFMFQKGFILPFSRIVDFYIPKLKIIIEVDGEYHLDLDVIRKDNIKDVRFLNERGMRTIRITNVQIFNGEYKDIVKFLIK